MRLWSLHPSYLDAIGLIALWREGLLARKVLLGQTKGYTRHPQLIRFRETGNPLQTMDLYLKAVHEESIRRGYSFDLSKISPCACQPSSRLLLPDKQLEYEFHHLLNKLRKRSPQQYYLLQQTTSILPPSPFSSGSGRYLYLGKVHLTPTSRLKYILIKWLAQQANDDASLSMSPHPSGIFATSSCTRELFVPLRVMESFISMTLFLRCIHLLKSSPLF